MIAVGDKMPEMELTLATEDQPDMQPSAALFSGKTVLFAVPGAYTPTCHQNHMPGFVEKIADIKAKGVDRVACLSVNDVFVMKNWGLDSQAIGRIDLIADGSALYTKALGMDLDLTERGLGIRSKRYALIIENGTVTWLGLEENPGQAEASSAEAVLAAL
ncbi:MAG: peroxiredoxin [Neomegalonema sp.]|nr:peroxiredoxin [Neomegalonema sp.]